MMHLKTLRAGASRWRGLEAQPQLKLALAHHSPRANRGKGEQIPSLISCLRSCGGVFAPLCDAVWVRLCQCARVYLCDG